MYHAQTALPPLIAIQAKVGELTALANEAASTVRAMVTLQPGTALYGPVATALAKAAGLPWPDRRRRLLVDSSRTADPVGWFDRVADLLTDLQSTSAPFVPVVVPATVRYCAEWIRGWHAQWRCGAAIRQHPSQVVAWDEVADALGVSIDAIDVVIDAAYVRHRHDVAAVRDAVTAMAPAEAFAEVRSATLLSGSVPRKRSTILTNELGRVELELWRAVRDQVPSIRYGDYGVIHPVPPDQKQDAKGFSTPNPYLLYSTSDSYLFATRHMPRKDKKRPSPEDLAEGFIAVAAELLAGGRTADAGFSWGDGELVARVHDHGVTDVTDWVAYGMSHHIAQLASEASAAA